MRAPREQYFRRNHAYGNGAPRNWPSRYWFRKQKASYPRGNVVPSDCFNCYGNRNVKHLTATWNDLRKKNLFCDAIIESADNKCFRVHRVILAAASDYFRAVFTSPLSVPSSNVCIKRPSNVIENIIQYCYTGNCNVNSKNVEALLPAADELGILGLLDLCLNYLLRSINVTNCWGIHVFCKNYFCHEVAEKAREFTLTHFLEFMKETNEFVALSVDDLVDILSDDHLGVRKEEQVFTAVDLWIQHDPNSRQSHAGRLLRCVRVNFLEKEFYNRVVLSSSYIANMSPNDINVMNIIAAEPMVKVWTDTRTREVDLVGQVPTNWPRIPNEIVFAIGGWSTGSPTNCVETFDIRANKWLPCLYSDGIARSYHGLVCLNNLIYMIGGFDGSTHFNTVRCFDPKQRLWSEKACMYHARCYVSCVVLGGFIYAIGGYNGHSRMNSVEKYDIMTNQWQEISPMKRARSDAGATVCFNKIFVAGGFSGHNVLISAEIYDPQIDNWTLIANMNNPRSGVSLVTYQGYVYAIGGFNGNQRLKSMERLNPLRLIEWDQNFPEMNTKRSNFACTILEDSILVVGGFNGTTTTALTECFNGKVWINLSPMEVNRSALAICTVTNLLKADVYSVTGLLKRRVLL
ncbi:hypothetical protein O3M35_011472 [Rhynocoris fuscipes]|uniref:Kelch-like protein diablo n=1 Tax=Rhynocoris fuscipes TaxID=488301 RepID=A0AAW1CWQ0_9HEMI